MDAPLSQITAWNQAGRREGYAGRYAPPKWLNSDKLTEAYLLGWNAGATMKALEDLEKIRPAFWEEGE